MGHWGTCLLKFWKLYCCCQLNCKNFEIPLFFTCHWFSFVFLLYGRRICTHSANPSLTPFLGEFPALGLALVPDVVVPCRGGTAVRMEQKTRSKFYPAGRGRTS